MPINVDNNKRMWLVKAAGGEWIEDFLNNNEIFIDFGFKDDISKYQSPEDILNRGFEKFDDSPNNTAPHSLYKFANKISVGDYVVTYDPGDRVYYFGKIVSNYFYDDKKYLHKRKVEWLNKKNPIPRDILKADTKYSLRTLLALSEITREDVRNDLFSILFNTEPLQGDNLENSASARVEDEQQVIDIGLIQEEVKSKIMLLDAEEMEELIAGVFRAMGYKTRRMGSLTQSDGGFDIIASKDGLGLSDETILVEVKHRKSKADSSMVRGFDSVLNNKNKRGVFFSSNGFTIDATREFKNSKFLGLMDLDYLVDLIFEYYENMDGDTKKLLPLKKVFIPV